MHAKFAVFDRRLSLVGSYNLDPRSATLNSETVVVFERAVLSARLTGRFYEEYLAFSRPVWIEEAARFAAPADWMYRMRKDIGSLFESQL